MKRWLFNGAAAGSLVLFLTVAVFWVMGYWFDDLWAWEGATTYASVGSNRGQVQFTWMIESQGRIADFVSAPVHRWCGIAYCGDFLIELESSHHRRLAAPADPYDFAHVKLWSVPHGYLELLFLPLPALWIWKWRVRRRQRVAG